MFLKFFQKSLVKKQINYKQFARIPPRFMNKRYQDLEINYDNFFTHGKNGITDGNKPLINQIMRISFELSNLCNYSNFHKKCPASRVEEKKVLSSQIVYKVIDEMSGIDFNGVFTFARYNEPLIDPRLFDFVKCAKTKCPDSKILILTNGFYLDQNIADELADLGVWIIAVSAYSMPEYRRLIKLNISVPYYVFFSILDDREDIYNTKPLNLKSNCTAPLGDLTINAFGKANLCCLDWQNRYNFGNLEEESVEEILITANFQKVHNDLSKGNRNLDICQRCSMIR